MIVTVGKRVKIELVSPSITLERNCESCGIVQVWRGDKWIDLPGNPTDAERFIEAYRRIVAEDVPYKRAEIE